MRNLIISLFFGMNILTASGCSGVRGEDALLASYRFPSVIPAPLDNQSNPARIELGKNLFFDPRLSGTNWISCATCHNPAMGWGDGLSLGFGHGMNKLGRHTPTLVNVAFFSTQFWDGRADSLESQALGPMASPGEMNQNLHEVSGKISKVAGYQSLFARAYPGERITAEVIAKAISVFERTIISRNSPFDRWLAGDEKAVSAEAKRGFKIFNEKGKCSTCHSGFNFSDDGFHNIGIKGADEGRYSIVKVKINKGAFKTPGLRDITRTGPYMHNGIYRTLEEVVDHYDRGGDSKENLDPAMVPLKLTGQEKKDLVEFMKTLDGELIETTIPRLPL